LHLGPVDQAARSPETGVAFACWYLYGVETVIAFAGAGRTSTETVIAFAGAKWVYLVQFSGCSGVCVVTNVVNPRCFSCGFLIRCYKRRQSDGFFAENQGFWTQIDDVCNMSTRKGVQIASV